MLIAQVIAQRPQIYLMDEPSSALDPRHSLRLFRFLRRRAAEGSTVVVAVHDINLASEHGDFVCILKRGRVEASGEIERVLSADLLADVYETPFEKFGEAVSADGRRRGAWRAV